MAASWVRVRASRASAGQRRSEARRLAEPGGAGRSWIGRDRGGCSSSPSASLMLCQQIRSWHPVRPWPLAPAPAGTVGELFPARSEHWPGSRPYRELGRPQSHCWRSGSVHPASTARLTRASFEERIFLKRNRRVCVGVEANCASRSLERAKEGKERRWTKRWATCGA